MTIGIDLGSMHTQPGYNDFNPGIYYEHRLGPTVGAYYNSERRMSVMAGWTFRNGNWVYSIGAVTGYKLAPVVPLATIGYVFDKHYRVSFVPNPKGASVFHLSYEF